jgi:hypothetical protein
MRSRLSPEEYRLLSDQKAADYRSFVQLNPGLLAITGAIFVGALHEQRPPIMVLATLPLLLAVFQLVRNSELQVQMTTYLAVFGPEGEGQWERDIAAVRPRYWKSATKSRGLWRASAWNVWILAAALITEVLVAFPVLSSWRHHPGWTLLIGTLLNVVACWYLFATSDRIEKKRDEWTRLWQEYLQEHPGTDGVAGHE